jgi:hypothetical protein
MIDVEQNDSTLMVQAWSSRLKAIVHSDALSISPKPRDRGLDLG